ncbi:hypothetical protein HAX54_006575 [Datura stramonium]|uniref:Uncharacterized protein n=1 Tax=Datura stramonium TaxID=4076 RepID=A0ABS8TBS9_DATST|nr:hypothetical protein [Datura stramonium]
MVVRTNKKKKEKKRDTNKALKKKTKVTFKVNKDHMDTGNRTKLTKNKKLINEVSKKITDSSDIDQQSICNITLEVNNGVVMEEAVESIGKDGRRKETKHPNTQESSNEMVEESVMESSSLNTEIKNKKGIDLVVDLNVQQPIEQYNIEKY